MLKKLFSWLFDRSSTVLKEETSAPPQFLCWHCNETSFYNLNETILVMTSSKQDVYRMTCQHCHMDNTIVVKSVILPNQVLVGSMVVVNRCESFFNS